MSKRIAWSIDGTKVYKINSNNTIRTAALDQNTMDLLDSDLYNSTNYNINVYYSYAFNFPQSVSIDKFYMRNNQSKNMTAFVSTLSTDGMDGTDWTQVLNSSPYTGGTYAEFDLTDTPCRWLKVNQNANDGYWNSLHLFGEYDSPNFEFWGPLGAGDTEITEEYVETPVASNLSIYAGYRAFTIKNTHPDGLPHSYVVTVHAHRYGGDAIIDNYYTVSDDPGGDNSWTRLATVTTPSIANGAFTDELRVYADLTQAQNPADGYHYWYVKVDEVAS